MHLERCAPTRSIFHPGSSTVELSEPGHEREADPCPGGVGRDGRALPERFEDGVAERLGNPGPVVLHGYQNAAKIFVNLQPYGAIAAGVPNGVHHQVLDDPLDLGRVYRHLDRCGVNLDEPVRKDVQIVDNSTRQRADIDDLVLRFDDASVQPVDVQEVLKEAVELPRVRGEPLQ